MDSSIFIYNYITTNNINGKQYVGMHSTEEVDDGYLGSGTLILKAIKKYGKENFTRDILEFCIDASVAHYNEGKYIAEYNTMIPNGYNLNPAGGLHKNGKHTLESRKKMSKALAGKPHPNNRRKGIYKHSEETKKKIGMANKGIKHSEKSRKNMGDAHKGQIAWNKGIPASEESKEKNRQKHIAKKQSKETIEKRRKKLIGRKMPQVSMETRLRMSESAKRRKRR